MRARLHTNCYLLLLILVCCRWGGIDTQPGATTTGLDILGLAICRNGRTLFADYAALKLPPWSRCSGTVCKYQTSDLHLYLLGPCPGDPVCRAQRTDGFVQYTSIANVLLIPWNKAVPPYDLRNVASIQGVTIDQVSGWLATGPPYTSVLVEFRNAPVFQYSGFVTGPADIVCHP